MHEMSLIRDLLKKVEAVAAAQSAAQVSEVRVKIGALAHCSADHFSEHFAHAASGTCAGQAKLVVTLDSDAQGAYAQDILLESVEVVS